MKGLTHLKVVKNFDSFKNEENICIVMEYFSGGDLKQLLKRGKLTERQTIKILEQDLDLFILRAQRHHPRR